MQTNDYIGVCLLVALDLDGGDQHPMYAMLIENGCNGSIVAAAHNQASRHLAMCFLLRKEHRAALDIVELLASRNPTGWTFKFWSLRSFAIRRARNRKRQKRSSAFVARTS
jgi:hypothetical protein